MPCVFMRNPATTILQEGPAREADLGELDGRKSLGGHLLGSRGSRPRPAAAGGQAQRLLVLCRPGASACGACYVPCGSGLTVGFIPGRRTLLVCWEARVAAVCAQQAVVTAAFAGYVAPALQPRWCCLLLHMT